MIVASTNPGTQIASEEGVAYLKHPKSLLINKMCRSQTSFNTRMVSGMLTMAHTRLHNTPLDDLHHPMGAYGCQGRPDAASKPSDLPAVNLRLLADIRSRTPSRRRWNSAGRAAETRCQ